MYAKQSYKKSLGVLVVQPKLKKIVKIVNDRLVKSRQELLNIPYELILLIQSFGLRNLQVRSFIMSYSQYN